MSTEHSTRFGDTKRGSNWITRRIVSSLWPNQRLRWTSEGAYYLIVWSLLLTVGLYQQVNLILLVAGLAAGPVIASIFVSAGVLSRLTVARRAPAYVFSGEPLKIDYTLRNERRWTSALALTVDDAMAPVDRNLAGSRHLHARVFFPQVAGGEQTQLRWEGTSPSRGRYVFKSLDLATRSPFGLLERHVTLSVDDSLIVYPRVGQLTRRWHLYEREASQTHRGQRHDRSVQQDEYHGLRDYRPGDSPRWIHWRTSARLGQPMVKEFEQQHEQDLAVLIDPWLRRTQVDSKQREAVEEAIRFAATLCHETCRRAGRRLLLGWTGAVPGMRQGPASVKLLHELLTQLATMRPSHEGGLAPLLDILPPATLREALVVVISTRPINLYEESEKSSRHSENSVRGMFNRVTLLDVSRGDLNEMIVFGNGESPSFARTDEYPAAQASTTSSTLATTATQSAVNSLEGSERRS